jgi:hypothetical protein
MENVLQRRLTLTSKFPKEKPNMNRILTTLSTIAIVASLLVAGAFAQGPPNYPPTWVYARAYNGWNIVGQQASTYTFNGGVCYYSPYNNGQSPSFFDFSGFQGSTTVYNPVFIQDSNAALNEIVTPTSTTNSTASCGFAATTANSHTSFTLSSGTAGLQEAITNQLQSTPAFVVVLDKYWYQLVAAFPSTTTPQSIIGALTGANTVYIVDTTTAPWTFYSWNGSKYVPDSSTGGIAFTSLTAISAPVALTTVAATCATNGGGCITTATTGGTIPASGAYTAGATYVTALGGETTLSTDTAAGATVTVGSTATNTITISSPAAETGAVGWRPYLTAASGASLSEILYSSSCASASTGQIVLNGVCAIGSSATITAIVTGTATVPTVNTAFPVASGTTSPLQNMVSYPPFADQGTISTGTVQLLGVVNEPTAFLNTLGRHIKFHGTGYATTNGTTGTLTFAIKLASVPYVTQVTPFTAVSGTTTASQVVNFTFDVDMTTQVTGSSGKVETHGTVCYNLAGTAVCTPAQDLIITNGSAIDLTKQDQFEFYLTPTTTGTTHLQLRQLTIQVLQ